MNNGFVFVLTILTFLRVLLLCLDGDEYFCSRDEAMKLVCVIDEVSGGVSGFMRVTYYG